MTVTLTPEQEAWLKGQVAAGALPSIEDGVRQAIADMMAIAEDDLLWARPYVDAARINVATGEVSDGDAFLGRLRTRISTLRTA